jgi:hypothetical protein
VIAGEDAFLYICVGEEVNVYDCERGSMRAGAREEAKAFDHEIRSAREEVKAFDRKIRSACTSAREEAHMLSHDR